MNTLFIRLLNLSIAATWIILAVILIRAFSKKAPKWFPCILWALVGIRLLCPVTIPSPLSLVPREEVIPINITEEKEPEVDSEMPVIAYTADPELGNVDHENTVVPSGNIVREAAPQTILPESDTKTVSSESRGMTLKQTITIASYVWISGLALMLGYALFSYIRLKRSLTACISVKDGVLVCDEVKSPFILGVFRPKIYVPSSIKEDALKHVLAHEESHIKRHDHWWKPLGFLILSVYWFHPLCWVSYVLLCRDIEMACDEKVIRMMKKEEAASYSQTLLDLSTRKTAIAACPVAFGEVGVKQRVKNVLNYKKPGFWVIVGVIVVSVAVSVLFLTKPMKKKEISNDETEATEENAAEDIPDSQTTTPSISDESNPSEPTVAQDSSSTEEPKTTAAPEVTEGIPGSRVAFIPDYDYENELKMEKEAVNADQLSLSHKRSFPMYRFDTKEGLDAFIQKYSEGVDLEKGGNGFPSFKKLTSEEAGYDSKFFEKNSILAVYVFAENLDFRASLAAQGIDSTKPGGVYQLSVSIKGAWPIDENKETQAGYFLLYDVSDEELAKASSLDAVACWDDDYYAYVMMRNARFDMDQELPEGQTIRLYDFAEMVGFGYEWKTDLQFNSISNIMNNLSNVNETWYMPCRQKMWDEFYLMYTTEDNYRLYLFFNYSVNGCTSPLGYGLVVGKVHTSSEFAGLKRGDSIDDVIKIDDVASLYKEYFLKQVNYNTDRAKAEEEDGNSICSLHYLDNGLAKIEYTMKEEGKLIIKDIEFYQNYIMEDQDGNEVDYRIFDIDLPK
ncbi:MAG: M56 family metallopeptidase [Clostridiales bacterium]|nr:M56 family metallopeptidase [Clostridiales bacterium]